MTSWCAPLQSFGRADVASAGGKGANLGELLRAGFEVPPGFVVIADAYRAAVMGIEPGEQSLRALELPPEFAAAIAGSYRGLGGGPVAVRSSATAEDLPGAAFAGQQETFLNVIGESAVLAAVRDCWASLWGERAVAYREHRGIDDADVAIAVVVQRLVPADVAGVMFTADPVTGARDRVVIDSSPGLGEAVVAGLVTPDHAVLDASGAVRERRAGDARVVVLPTGDGGTTTAAGAAAPALEDAVLARIAAAGRRIASHFGRPQDVEWALAEGRLWVLQARPMTALPPAPRKLGRFQRSFGPIILELLPRRPLPMEVSAWIEPSLEPLVTGMIEGIAGLHFDFGDVLRATDGVVTEYVPAAPRPTLRMPGRLLGSLRRAWRDPALWLDDPDLAAYREGCRRLSELDPAGLTWAELGDLPAQAGRLMAVITRLRVRHLPAAGRALVGLQVLLWLVGSPGRFVPLIADAATATRAANDELAALAGLVRADPLLREAFGGRSGEELVGFVADAPLAVAFRTQLAGFLRRFGHRETGSLLLLRDPTWGAAPAIVLDLVKVLAQDEALGSSTARVSTGSTGGVSTGSTGGAAGLWGHLLGSAIARARAGMVLREDTHFECTRLMPVIRAAVIEAGRRLAEAGRLDDPADVWLLLWPEVADTDPVTGAGPDLRAAVARRRQSLAELAGSPLIATATLYGTRRDGNALVEGTAGGGGRTTGPVRVILGPGEFSRLQTGDVLVCPATNPSWTPLFARAAAVVVDHGGVASHAAIVAREYGIPAIMGTGDGSTVLVDGRRVMVDGDRGVVLDA